MSEKFTAFILAAGFSSRMGVFKPLLPLGKVTVLGRTVALFRDSGIEDVRVVTGYRSFELEPILKKLGVRIIHNPLFTEGMFSSIQAAVKTISIEQDAFFILPVDIPLIRPSTIDYLTRSFRQNHHEINYPCFLRQRGHPPLISRKLASHIARWHGHGGLNAALSRWEQCACDVEVPDENILFDMDTDQDYQSMKEKVRCLDIPTEAECRALLTNIFNVGDKISRHGQAVANISVQIGKALNNAGYNLDLRILKAGGLLHDIAKSQPDHAEVGARIIRKLGYGAVADIVAAHADIIITEEKPVSESEVLYIADKLVRGDQPVSLEERFRQAFIHYADDLKVLENVERRWQNTLSIKKRLESVLGCSLGKVLATDEQYANQLT